MITMSQPAFERINERQLETLRGLCHTDKHTLDIVVDFSLGDTWVAFLLTYPSGTQIYGAVSPEGDAHT